MEEMGDANPLSLMMNMGQPTEGEESEGDDDLVPGSSATFPLGVKAEGEAGNGKKAQKNGKKPPRRKFLDTYCENLTRKEEEEKGKKHKCKDYVIIGDPGTELKKISLDEFYKNFTGVLLLLNPTSEFKGGKIEKGGMMKRYINLLLPQKKLFFYAILSSIITHSI